jgi:hypothetical protein
VLTPDLPWASPEHQLLPAQVVGGQLGKTNTSNQHVGEAIFRNHYQQGLADTDQRVGTVPRALRWGLVVVEGTGRPAPAAGATTARTWTTTLMASAYSAMPFYLERSM